MKTVLVVDDEFGIAEFLMDVLAEKGYSVITAANGKQALARIGEAKPDLVLLDFMMPVMNGAGMLKALAGDPTTRDIPVVMMSALGESAIAEECDGYAAFLRKPFKISTVIETVARLIAGNAKTQ